MNPIQVLKRYFMNIERSRQLLDEIREGVANLTDVTNRHLVKLTAIREDHNQYQKLAEMSHELLQLLETLKTGSEDHMPEIEKLAKKAEAVGQQYRLPPSINLLSLGIASTQRQAPFPMVQSLPAEVLQTSQP